MTLYKLLLQHCIRSKEVWVSMVLMTLIGMLSIAIGNKHLKSQQEAIAAVATYQEQHFERQVALHNEDLGLLLYYTKFAYIHAFDPLAGIAIGQADVHPAIKRITIKTFEGQKFDTDLVNPMQLQSGNLDLSFVILYLFPLLVIVLTFNVISEETETGTWRLVVVQTRAKLSFVIAKLSVRFLLLITVLLLLFGFAKLVLDVPLNKNYWILIGLSVLYLLFWFALSFVVIVCKKSSGFNALLLLSVWLLLMILVPAGINSYVASKYPVPEALSTAIAQRDGYHTKWDTDKMATIEKFYTHYPQFKHYGYPTAGFNWLWYYAMQQMGDDDSKTEQDALREKINIRERVSNRIATVFPNMGLQLAFNQLAGTSMGQHMAYLDSVEAFHEKLRLFFYPKVFEGQCADSVDWRQLPPAYYTKDVDVAFEASTILFSLLLASLFMIVIAIPITKRL